MDAVHPILTRRQWRGLRRGGRGRVGGRRSRRGVARTGGRTERCVLRAGGRSAGWEMKKGRGKWKGEGQVEGGGGGGKE